jgi:hypothetical protein
VFLQPFVHVEEEILLGPQHPGQRLPHHERFIFADPGRRYGLVELIGLMLAVPA